MQHPVPLLKQVSRVIFGKAKDPFDAGVFQKISLVAFFAWIGLGADGLSSSCYGPEEAFVVLRSHPFLALLVAVASVVTILVISASYTQIIELFPSGGGGYMVASKLLSPTFGMISGCALLIDYVLTISISVACGADAVFSFLPPEYQAYKLGFGIVGILLLTMINLRGVKESVALLIPIFVVFIATHAGGMIYALTASSGKIASAVGNAVVNAQSSYAHLGFVGMLLLFIRAYSMGAGTYTGIEAISNGVSMLREPKTHTARRTMLYMVGSLAFLVVGLMSLYVIMGVKPHDGKTLNAVLFSQIFGKGITGGFLLFLTLFSEAALLFVAAQTGFLDGPRVIANMALDRWLPSRFTLLSDRLVIKNGILLMGGAAFAAFILSRGSVRLLIVLYSINVFITFILSQLGMVRHWWTARFNDRTWIRKMAVNGVGLGLTVSILISVVYIKFNEGGWITLLLTLGLIVLVVMMKRHYVRVSRLLNKLNDIAHVDIALQLKSLRRTAGDPREPAFDPAGKTAVLLVNGFNGLGLRTLCNIFSMFKGVFKNFIFVQVGIIDVGAFKSTEDVERVQLRIKGEVSRYVDLMRSNGFYAEGVSLAGIDVVSEIGQEAPRILERVPEAVFFGGQLIFPEGTFVYKWLHNYTVFALQKKLYHYGIPFILIPVRLHEVEEARFDLGAG